MGKIGRLAVRNLVATVSMAALAVTGTAVAGDQKKSDKDAKVARGEIKVLVRGWVADASTLPTNVVKAGHHG